MGDVCRNTSMFFLVGVDSMKTLDLANIEVEL